MRLEGKVAVVTGAASGIGAECAAMFAREGAQVLGCDIDAAWRGGSAFSACWHGDLTNEADVAMLAEVIGGKVDILVNAAAAAMFAWIEDMHFSDWRKTLAGELDSVFLVTRALWPQLKASGTASVVNFASANAHHALEGSAALAHCTGKGGVLAMTRQLAMEGAPYGIRANTISPGFIRTAATDAHLAAEPGLGTKILAKNMVKRFGVPADIAACATWLASDEAGYVTGADIPVDGGATAW